MALTVCPHCGKQISDTVEVCIHCGKKVAESLQKEEAAQTPRLRAYEKLTDYERRELEKEFVKGKPKYDKFFGNKPAFELVHKILSVVSTIACVFILLFVFIKGGFTEKTRVFYFVGLSIIIICFAADIICYLAVFKYRKQLLVVLKKYQKWLKGKNVEYTLNFKWLWGLWSRYYNNINPDAEDI